MIFNGYEYSFCVFPLDVWLPGERKGLNEGSAVPLLHFQVIKFNLIYVELTNHQGHYTTRYRWSIKSGIDLEIYGVPLWGEVQADRWSLALSGSL